VIKSKKLLFLLIYFLIVGNVLISGCIDQDNIESKMSSSQGGILYSEYDYNDLPVVKIMQDFYEFIEEENYPTLDNLNIEFNNPNMELVASYFVDTRTHESDPDWAIYLIVQNNGKDGVWIGNMEGLSKETRYNYIHEFLGRGDIKIYVIHGSAVEKSEYLPNINLNNLLNDDITFTLDAYDTTTPRVSSDFGHFYLQHDIANSNHVFDVESIDYKVDNENWKYVVIKLNNPTSSELSGRIKVEVAGADSSHDVSEDSLRTFTLSPGGSETFEMCLRDNEPKAVDRIVLSPVY